MTVYDLNESIRNFLTIERVHDLKVSMRKYRHLCNFSITTKIVYDLKVSLRKFSTPMSIYDLIERIRNVFES